MKAWVINKYSDLRKEEKPLKLTELEEPEIKEDEILVSVIACGVCHTEIDEIEGRIKLNFPVVPGHQVVGAVIKRGSKVTNFKEGDIVGAGWIYSSCGNCEFCKKGLENLCPQFMATGKDVNGGYAEYFKIKEKFAFKIPSNLTPFEAAPLLCAGAIGYRSLKLTNISKGETLGLVGFGASAHLVLKTVKYLYPDTKVLVFSRTKEERELAIKLGAYWAGEIEDEPPLKLNAIIDTTPVWKPPFHNLRHLKPGGILVINAIRKEDIDKDYLLNIDYPRDLWLEKKIKSVANVTRKDIEEFLEIAGEIPIKPEYQIYPFETANKALLDIKNRRIKGAKVLKVRDL
ncbi:MAG: zinc-dependent alcohol dehydrogenase family protein [Thermosulfidibacteraceae bacterium]